MGKLVGRGGGRRRSRYISISFEIRVGFDVAVIKERIDYRLDRSGKEGGGEEEGL